MNSTQVESIMDALNELKEDTGVPKNVKGRIADMIVELKSPCCDGSMLINKMLNELDELSSDINLQPFVRTQIFNISSLLETLY